MYVLELDSKSDFCAIVLASVLLSFFVVVEDLKLKK